MFTLALRVFYESIIIHRLSFSGRCRLKSVTKILIMRVCNLQTDSHKNKLKLLPISFLAVNCQFSKCVTKVSYCKERVPVNTSAHLTRGPDYKRSYKALYFRQYISQTFFWQGANYRSKLGFRLAWTSSKQRTASRL